MKLMRVNLMILSAEGCEKAKNTDYIGDEYLVQRVGYIDPSRIDSVEPSETLPNCIYVRIGNEDHTVVDDMDAFVTRVENFVKKNYLN